MTTLTDEQCAAEVWVVFGEAKHTRADFVADSREEANEHCNLMAEDFPELGPWRVRRFVDAAGASVPREPTQDENDALDLLAEVYSLYENGMDVMEDGDIDNVCIGKSVKLDHADEDRIIELLNRRRPHDAATGGKG